MQQWDCECCWGDFSTSQRVFWNAREDDEPQPIDWCQSCVKNMLQNHYNRWRNSLEKADCKAALKRLIGKGPPVTVAHAIEGLTQPDFPKMGHLTFPNGETKSGLLSGAPENATQMQALMDELEEMRELLALAES